jgi:hypothetical protein
LRLFCGGCGLGDADALLLGGVLAEGSTSGALLGTVVLGDTLPLVPP